LLSERRSPPSITQPQFSLHITHPPREIFKTRVTLSTLSLPVLVILRFIILLKTKTNFLNIFSTFRGSELHYTHFLQRKPLLIFFFLDLCDFFNTLLICSTLIIQICSCVCVSASYSRSHFRIQ
jgi:hypothetical protein